MPDFYSPPSPLEHLLEVLEVKLKLHLQPITHLLENILSNFTNFNASLAALQTTVNNVAIDVQRLITDFASNGGDQAVIDQAQSSLDALTSAVGALDTSVNTADPNAPKAAV